ncbi:MAG: ankyrin repeat domain-containing protein [Clostridiales bacterium]|nr:ankyrin repeat domain-containing protein [Clostridiales bacterium]
MTKVNNIENELKKLKENFSSMEQENEVVLRSEAFVDPVGNLVAQIDIFNYTEDEIAEGKTMLLKLVDRLSDDEKIVSIIGDKQVAKTQIEDLFTRLLENRNNIASSSCENERKKEYTQLLKGFRLIAEVLSDLKLSDDVLASNLVSIKESGRHCSQNWKHTLISFMVIFREYISPKISMKTNILRGDELDEIKRRFFELFYKAKYDIVNDLVYGFKRFYNVESEYDPHYKEICTNYMNKKYKLYIPQLDNIPDNYIKDNDLKACDIRKKFDRYLKDKTVYQSIDELIYDRVCDLARCDEVILKHLKDWFLYYINKNDFKLFARDRAQIEKFLYDYLLKGQACNEIAYAAIREMIKDYGFIEVQINTMMRFNRVAIKQMLLDTDVEDEKMKRIIGKQLNNIFSKNVIEVIEFVSKYKQYDLYKYLDLDKFKDIDNMLIQIYQNNNTGMVKFLVENGIDVDQKNEYKETILWYVIRNKNVELLRLLINKGANINSRDRYGDTPLWYAVKNEDVALAKLLIANGANVNKLDKNKENILSYAIWKNNEELVKLLVVNGVKLNALSRYGRTAFWNIAMNKNMSIAKLLIRNKIDINLIDVYGENALWYAVGFRNKKLAKLLLKFGVYTDLTDTDGKTILSYAIKNGETKMAKLLIHNKADVNKEDHESKTALWYAVEKNNIDIVKMLIEYGADMEVKKKDGETLLIYAVKNKKQNILNVLLNNGANIDNVDQFGKTALWYAIKNDLLIFVEILMSNGAKVIDKCKEIPLWYTVKHQNISLTKAIINNGINIDIDAANQYGKTALWYAIMEKNIEIIDLLINNGATKMGVGQETAFWYAIKNRNTKLIRQLIKNGVDVNEKNSDGENALWYAVKNGDYKLTKLLIDNGININKKNKYNKTALWYAIHNNNKRITELLIKNGADKTEIKREKTIQIPRINISNSRDNSFERA